MTVLIAETSELTAPPAAKGRTEDGLKPATTPGTKEPVPVQSAMAAEDADKVTANAKAAVFPLLTLNSVI